MPKVLATVQAGQFSDEQIRALETCVRKHYATHIGSGRIAMIWCVVPEGQCYTNYAPSQSSLLSIECPNGLAQDRRVAMLKACEQDWIAITGQHSDSLMLAVLDADKFAELLAANQARLSGFGRLRFNLHMLISLLRSKLSRGYLAFNPNL